jgi:4a-hydroxytetrahydrobiopterin dehydratase
LLSGGFAAHGLPVETPKGWIEDGGTLKRCYRFADFTAAFAFLTRVAAHAEAVDHHPHFTSRWNVVDFELTSHDAGGVTARDIALARAIDALVEAGE